MLEKLVTEQPLVTPPLLVWLWRSPTLTTTLARSGFTCKQKQERHLEVLGSILAQVDHCHAINDGPSSVLNLFLLLGGERPGLTNLQ